MKAWQKISVIIVVVLLLLAFVKDFLIKSVVTSVGANVVGAPIEIGGLSLGLLSQKVKIKNFKLYNPPGFPHEAMVNLPEISVESDLGSFFKGKIHLPLVVFNLKEMVVIKNKEGKLNVDSLKVMEAQKKEPAAKGEQSPKKESAMLPIQIDVLKLNVERVILKDYTKGSEPTVSSFEVALKDKTFRNITSVQQMSVLIMAQAMGPTAIKSAGMYAAATVLGVGFLPAGIVGAMIGKDNSSAEYPQSFDKVYDTALAVLKQKGQIKSENKSTGQIQAKAEGCDIKVKIEKQSNQKILATVFARQFMMPKAEVAGGIIYEMSQKLK